MTGPAAASRARAPIVLASSSAIRAQLLAAAGVAFEVVAPHVDEAAIKEGLRGDSRDAGTVADVLAEHKAQSVSRRAPGRLVIAADQVLVMGRRQFDKPTTRTEAADQLRALSGRTHELVTVLCSVCDNERIWHHQGRARLHMRTLDDGFIEAYLDAIGAAAFWGPGAYQIAGLRAQLFSHVEGDSFTVQGLPLLPLLDHLRTQGALRS